MKELYCLVFCGLLALAYGQGSYTHSKSIDANYKISWKLLNKTHIGFQTEVRASGWFGFGLSADGMMFPGDVVVGYVDRTTAVLSDYYTTGYKPPTLDDSQDWLLVSGSNTNHKLVFQFVRALNTHDRNDAIISGAYTHAKTINSKYRVLWKALNKTHIGFQTEVAATGWFGFGVSTDGHMFPGDVVVGYVDHNSAMLNDYHTTGYKPPTLDDSQDWSLVSGTVVNKKLVFQFVRPYDTSDNANDIVIRHGNINLIWAFSNSKPTSPSDFLYHGDNRGSILIDLFSNANVVGK